jgi:hypothetical protein
MLRTLTRECIGALIGCVLAGLLSLGCSSDPSGSEGEIDNDRPPVRARFELGPSPMAWGAIPWPDDLYLKDGHVSVTSLPFATKAQSDTFAQALSTSDGAGVRPTLVFAFDSELKRESLPGSPIASLAPEASVFLIDADASSPDAFERVPLDVGLSSDGRSIRARVAFSRSLTPGRRYAAVVTDALRARAGDRRVAASDRLQRILDSAVPLTDAREKLARLQYLPILPALAAKGLTRSRIVALASFRAQSVGRELDEARASFDEGDVGEEPRFERVIEGAELDELLGATPANATGAVLGVGVDHEHIAMLAHLSIQTPLFVGVAEGGRSGFMRNSRGALVRRGTHDVPCTLIVPRLNGSSALRIVLFQHGLFAERSDALPVANALAATGSAVLTCDAPLHGSRLSGTDTGSRFSGSNERDGFGDVIGDLIGQEPGAGEWPPAHPFYYRDAVQQAVIDWMAIVATLRSGAWDEPLQEALGSEDANIAQGSIGFIGIDLGAEIGVPLSAREPTIGAVVLAFAGGRAIDDWNVGPDYASYREAFEDVLNGEDAQGFAASLRGDVSVLRALLDPATALAHASDLQRTSTNLLLYIAEQDELVPRASSEALAYGLGAALVDDEVPQHELELRRTIALPGAAISANFTLARGAVTRVAQSISPCTHSALFTSEGTTHFEHPLQPNLRPLEDEVANPTDALLRQVVFFFESYKACQSTQTEPQLPCAALVGALATDS